MNADAELNDARQSLFSEVILRYGHLLGREEYLQRGEAALPGLLLHDVLSGESQCAGAVANPMAFPK